MRLIIIDTGRYKDLITSRMRRRTGIQGAWMVYKGCDREYAEQVTAEHKVKVKGKPLPQWVPKTSHADNHYLDCEVYAACAADMLGARTLYLDDEKAEEEQKKRQQMDRSSQTREQGMNLWLPSNTSNWI